MNTHEGPDQPINPTPNEGRPGRAKARTGRPKKKPTGRRKQAKRPKQPKGAVLAQAQPGPESMSTFLDCLTPEERRELEAALEGTGWDGSPEHLAALLAGG